MCFGQLCTLFPQSTNYDVANGIEIPTISKMDITEVFIKKPCGSALLMLPLENHLVSRSFGIHYLIFCGDTFARCTDVTSQLNIESGRTDERIEQLTFL